MRMRVAVSLGLAALAVVPSSVHAAAPDRRASASYTLDAPTRTLVLGAREDRLTATADDTVSAVTRVTIEGTAPDGSTRSTSGCNRASLAMPPRSTMRVTVGSGTCGANGLAVASYGTLQLAFHQQPPKPVRRVATAAHRWALLIGIQDYAGRTHSTIGADGDVAAIRSALLRSGWRSDHIRVLTERQATAAGIRSAVDELVARSGPDTFTLMHYSGHVCIASRGPCASGHTYLWSQDNRFISEDELRSRLEGLQGYSWLDVAGCESGAFDRGFHSPRRLFTASSRADETSYEDPRVKQSVWVSRAWVQGYVQGSADKHGRAYRATMRQLAAYGAAQSASFTSGTGRPQHPVWVGGDPSWTLATPPGR